VSEEANIKLVEFVENILFCMTGQIPVIQESIKIKSSVGKPRGRIV
jgi:hypothetical protein